ncbi:unnamed protein product [Rhodiola kirilowii]
MGAHSMQNVRAPMLFIMLLVVTLLQSSTVTSKVEPESNILLQFKQSIANSEGISKWDPSTSPCDGDDGNWEGVLCYNGYVWGLKLENMGLMGFINVDLLSKLPYLRTLSFMNNSFNTPIPDIKKLGGLKSLYLSNNDFSGEIPDDAFSGMGYLKKVYLANNKFRGKIPSSLAKLPKLLYLRLEGNSFEGEIPDFQQKDLKVLDLSNNELEGPIPESLSNISLDAFQGNKALCGKPFDACPDDPTEQESSSGSKGDKQTSGLMIAVIVLACLLGLILLAIIIVLLRRKKPEQPILSRSPSMGNQKLMTDTTSQLERRVSEKPRRAEQGKLSFIKEDNERFDLNDLLRSSAEVLGSGTFGASYKAVISSGEAYVVKRYKHMNNVGRDEFHEHMRRLGRLRHPNLLPLVAYYYRREEKLLISNFVYNGSLAGQLHGKHSKDQPALSWGTRLKIIKGVVKGLAYLYSELPSMTVPHSHLKSSNVLLDESFEPLLSDYALLPVINLEHAQQLMVAYKSPEYAQHGRTMRKTDIWSLGFLILEILTGKFPMGYMTQGAPSTGSCKDLVSWVRTVYAEEDGMNKIYDKEMGDMTDHEGEMLKLLRIGLGCCEEDVEVRWDLKKVVEKIEEIKGKEDEIEWFPTN